VPAEQSQSKFSLPEVIVVTTFLIVGDLVDVLLLLVGLDDFMLVDLLFGFPLMIYLWWKGARGTYVYITFFLELIPYVGKLPLRTIGFLLAVQADRHPVAARAVTTVAGRTNPEPSGK